MYCTYLGVFGYNFQKVLYFMPGDLFLTFINNVDTDEIQHNAAFHLGLPCLPKYPFRGFHSTKV